MGHPVIVVRQPPEEQEDLAEVEVPEEVVAEDAKELFLFEGLFSQVNSFNEKGHLNAFQTAFNKIYIFSSLKWHIGSTHLAYNDIVPVSFFKQNHIISSINGNVSGVS